MSTRKRSITCRVVTSTTDSSNRVPAKAWKGTKFGKLPPNASDYKLMEQRAHAKTK